MSLSNRHRRISVLAPLLLSSVIARGALAQTVAPARSPVAAPSAPPAPSTLPASTTPPPPTVAAPTPNAASNEGTAGVVSPSVAAAEDGAWKYHYDLACDRLVNGDFATAADLFDGLVSSTRDPKMRALVTFQASLAREWQRRGLALVKQSALGDSAISAKSVNERSTDEIAILYTNAVIYGIGSGAALAVATQANGTAGIILPMLLLGGASAGTVALLDAGRPLRYGVPQSIVSGMYVGLEEGLALSLWGSQSSAKWSGQTVAGVTWGVTTIGAVAGGVLGATVGTTPGRASFVGTTSLWGGALSGFAVEAFNGTGDASGPLLATTVGAGLGAIGGLLAAGPVSPSIARVRFLDLGAVAGGLVAGGIYLSAANHDADPHAASGITALGIAAGLATSWAATSGMAPDRQAQAQTPDRTAFSWSPTMMPAKEGMMIGVAGTM
jgi:hypothetical protein